MYSLEYNEICLVISTQTLWNETYCRVWLPLQDTVVRVRADQLRPLNTHHSLLSTHYLVYIAAAARITEALAQGALLALVKMMSDELRGMGDG
ncbi:MAG: hypothetical protein AB1374_10310 [Bacillota bacterium]